MNILFMDAETTGTDETKHAIIELAAELHVDGVKISEFNEKFYDRRSPVSLQALKYNKTSLKSLWERTPEDEATIKFIDWVLSLNVKGPIILCGHNVPFDIKFLKALLAKYQVADFDAVVGYKIQDTCVIGMFLVEKGIIKTEGNKTTLEALAKGLNVDMSGLKLHTAKDDTTLTARVYYAMLAL